MERLWRELLATLGFGVGCTVQDQDTRCLRSWFPPLQQTQERGTHRF